MLEDILACLGLAIFILWLLSPFIHLISTAMKEADRRRHQAEVLAEARRLMERYEREFCRPQGRRERPPPRMPDV
jgi:hypothetical protein